MITATNASIFLGGELIVDDASFLVSEGELVAIVGPNGAGKSTLMKAVAGKVSLESGEITLPKNTTVGYLPQIARLDPQRTIRDEMKSVFDEALSAIDEMRELEHKMGEIDHDSDEFRQVARRYDFLLTETNRLDAYNLDSKVGQVSAGLGFQADDLDRPCAEFS